MKYRSLDPPDPGVPQSFGVTPGLEDLAALMGVPQPAPGDPTVVTAAGHQTAGAPLRPSDPLPKKRGRRAKHGPDEDRMKRPSEDRAKKKRGRR